MNSALALKWSRVGERHARAVKDFLEAGAGLDSADWNTPFETGKWSPDQITQHLIRTYEVLVEQLRTGRGLEVRTGWLLRQFLRLFVLRPIMWTRRLPPGAAAVREILPTSDPGEQSASLARLREAVDEFVRELEARRADDALRLRHHIFGEVPAVDGLDFVAVHTEHHCRQLSSLLPKRAASAAG